MSGPAIAVNHESQPGIAAPTDRLLFYGLFALLMFEPLAFGGVEPWAIFLLEAGSAVLLLRWAWKQAGSGELRVFPSPLFGPMLCLAILVAAQLGFGLAAYRQATLHQALLYCAYGSLAFLTVQVLRRSWQVEFLGKAFSLYGFFVALFALFQGLASNGKLYWVRTPSEGGWIYGPYVNHNHYAGLMELLLPIPLIIALSHLAPSRQRVLAAIAAAVMAATIFLSGSRGGMLAFMVQMTVVAGFLARQKKGRRMALALIAFLVPVAGLLIWLGGAELAHRVSSIQSEARTEIAGGTRVQIVRDGLHLFRVHPILGFGLGNFPEVYPRYRSFYTNLFVNQAHNDFLQLLVELGGVGLLLSLWFLWRLYSRAGSNVVHWADDVNGSMAMSTMLSCTGILVHSAFDFNLQIPANAALFFVFCVVAALEPRFGLRRRRGHV